MTSARSRRNMISAWPVDRRAGHAPFFLVLASWLLGKSKFACLQRQKPAMFAQMPVCVYRHFTGAACTTSSDGRFAAFSLASRLSKSSDMVRSRTSRSRPLFSAPNSKLFAGNYGCNHRRRLGAWHAPGRRWEPECEAVRLRVAQVVKVQAGCVAIWQRLRAIGRPACHHR